VPALDNTYKQMIWMKGNIEDYRWKYSRTPAARACFERSEKHVAVTAIVMWEIII